MDTFTLSRNWFNYCFENPEQIKPSHTALYFFCIEHCNRLGGKEKFGLPTTMAKEAIGIHSYNTYISTLKDLVDWGFIKMIETSKNQYSSNIIALSKYDKALNKALDKALIKHSTKHVIKQSESTVQSTDSINKQINKETIELEPEPIFQEINLDLVCNYKSAINILVTEKNYHKTRDIYKLTNAEIEKYILEFLKLQEADHNISNRYLSEVWKHFNRWLKINIKNTPPENEKPLTQAEITQKRLRDQIENFDIYGRPKNPN